MYETPFHFFIKSLKALRPKNDLSRIIAFNRFLADLHILLICSLKFSYRQYEL